ncbi:MAG: hypothetical protein ACKV2V_14260 [Blastocatellia bacterium]
MIDYNFYNARSLCWTAPGFARVWTVKWRASRKKQVAHGQEIQLLGNGGEFAG